MSKNILNYLLIFLVVSLGLQLLFPKPVTTNTNQDPVHFAISKKEYPIGKTIELSITNNTDKKITFASKCPVQPFQVFKIEGTTNTALNSKPEIDCNNKNDSALKDISINPNKTSKVRYTYWSHNLFSELGEYKIGTGYTYQEKEYQAFTNSFQIVERGFWSKFWLGVFYQPIYNVLIWMISISPNFNLGLGIIFLTILVRIILYFPNQKALVAQKKLAEVQPKLTSIKEKHKDNQQKMAEETMKIWKEHKVNPASSCLPILIQFPVLIALFYVIQDGLNPDKTWLLYSFISDFNFSQIETYFLSLNLLEKNIIALPLIVGALQFVQLKLSMNKNTNSAKSDDPNVMVQKTMIYIMPAMIAVFTASLPAGIGIYWGTSTLFGIVQQFFVNKHVDKEMKSIPNKKNKKESTRVIDLNESK